MKNQEQKEYEAPQTTCLEVELEQGFMKASIFEQDAEHDKGVTIQNHEFGESLDFTEYTGEDWD